MPLEFFIDEDTRRTPLTEEEKKKREEESLNRMLRHAQIENDVRETLRQKSRKGRRIPQKNVQEFLDSKEHSRFME
jgi:hypothetical protein